MSDQNLSSENIVSFDSVMAVTADDGDDDGFVKRSETKMSRKEKQKKYTKLMTWFMAKTGISVADAIVSTIVGMNSHHVYIAIHDSKSQQ